MLNKYEVIGVIGEGAYGIVLKCKHKETQEIVAIKKFKESDDDEIVRKTTMREVKVLRTLKQDNIVNMYEAFKRKGKLYLVFEYASRNMLELLDSEPSGLSAPLVKKFTYQLLKALTYCHHLDIVHRDIKPENLLLTSDMVLKLCDFGFARSVGGSHKNSDLTEWYRAPELLLGTTRYNKPVDIWAVGCIMGEMATGQPVFPGESEIDQLYIIQRIVGALTPEQHALFMQNPRFAGFKFPDMSYPETIRKKYVSKMEDLALDLMINILQMDSAKRPTGIECMQHPYFDDIREVEPQIIPPIPAVAKIPSNPNVPSSLLSPSPPSNLPSPSSLSVLSPVKSPRQNNNNNNSNNNNSNIIIIKEKPPPIFMSNEFTAGSPPHISTPFPNQITRDASNKELAPLIHPPTNPEIPKLDLQNQNHPTAPPQFHNQQQLHHLLLQHQQQQQSQNQQKPKSRKKNRARRPKNKEDNGEDVDVNESIESIHIQPEKTKDKERRKKPLKNVDNNSKYPSHGGVPIPSLPLESERRSKHKKSSSPLKGADDDNNNTERKERKNSKMRAHDTSPLKNVHDRNTADDEHVEYIEISARAASRKASRQPNTTRTKPNVFMKFGAPASELPRINDDEGGILDINSLAGLSLANNNNTQGGNNLSNSGERFGMHNAGSNANMHGFTKYNNNNNNSNNTGGGTNNDRSPYANVVGKGNVKMPSLVKQK